MPETFLQALREIDQLQSQSDDTDQLRAENSALQLELTAADAEIDRLADTTAGPFAAAVGAYDCPCGSTFEFAADSTLEDYASLNRWLGRHVNNDEHDARIHDPDSDLFDAVVELSRKRRRDNETLTADLQRANRDRDMLREQARALLDRVQELDTELADLQRRIETLTTERDVARAVGS